MRDAGHARFHRPALPACRRRGAGHAGGFVAIVLALNPLSAAIARPALVLMAALTAFVSYNQEVYLRREYRTAALLAWRTTELAEAAEPGAASDAKSRFLAMMIHEQRTPLNAIIGFAEVTAR